MWLFTRYGFYSVAAGDRDSMLIRARSGDHLARLRQRFTTLKRYNIQYWPDRDYLCRLVVPRQVWADVAAKLTDELDYPNFKNEVASSFGKESDYLSRCHETWAVMQKQAARTGGD